VYFQPVRTVRICRRSYFSFDGAAGIEQPLEELIIPPTSLPGVIIWIKAQIELYKPPYEAHLKQIAEYTAKLQKIQQLFSEKAAALACSETEQL